MKKHFIFLELILALSYRPVSEFNCQRHEQVWTSAAHIPNSLLCYVFNFVSLGFFILKWGFFLFKVKLKAFLFLACFEMLIKKIIIPNKISFSYSD